MSASALTTAEVTARPPVTLTSAISSPVKLRGAQKPGDQGPIKRFVGVRVAQSSQDGAPIRTQAQAQLSRSVGRTFRAGHAQDRDRGSASARTPARKSYPGRLRTRGTTAS